MRFWVVFVSVIVGYALVGDAQQKAKPPLYGWVVVLDPGHGGRDPGASGDFDGKRVVEDEYVFDVALRAKRRIKALGGVVYMTIQDNVGERALPAQEVFPDAKTERYTGNPREIVKAGAWGLNQRLVYGNAMKEKHPKHHHAWISIHFDALGINKIIDGVRIIHGVPSRKLADALGESFASQKRLRDVKPIVVNGDKGVGLRNLQILRGGNKFQERVLIELGNFNNVQDVWRIRNPYNREEFARAIAEGLIGWKK